MERIYENFSWLPLSDRKGVTLPPVYVEPYTGQYSGYYDTWNARGTQQCILVITLDPEVDLPSVLAHEFRHHTQAHLNQERATWSSKQFDWLGDYEEALRAFYQQRHELDALLYEHRTARCDSNDWCVRDQLGIKR